MNTLINLVLSIVLNVFSNGTNQPTEAFVSQQESIQICEKQHFTLEDLKSNYVITKEEVIRNQVITNVGNSSTN